MTPSIEKPAVPSGAPVSADALSAASDKLPSTRQALDELKKGMEKIVDPEDRKKADVLLSRLQEVSVSKLDARDAFNNLKIGMTSAEQTDTKALMERMTGAGSTVMKAYEGLSVDNTLKTGAGKIGDVARGTIAQAQEAGAKVVEAVKTGDMKEVKKLAEGIIEKTNEAGQKIREYSGMAALEKVLEPLKTQGIFGIFWVLANFWKFLTGGMKWSEMMEGAQAQTAGAVAAGTGAVQAAAGKVDSALQTFQKMTPEEREKLTEKMADGIADDLSRTYLWGAKLSPEKIKKIKEIIASSDLNAENLQKLSKKILENGKITFGDTVEILWVTTFWVTELMWKIAFSGIVPLTHIAYEAVANGSKTAVGLTFHGLGLPPMTMSIEEIHALISKHSATGGEKAMSLVQSELYRPLGVFWAVTSGIIANIAKLGIAVGVDTASGANGLSVLRWLTGIGGDYQSVFREFDLINRKFSALPNNPHNQGMTDIINELKSGMKTMTKNWQIIAILDEVKYDKAKFLAHPELSKVMEASEIAAIKQAPNFQTALKDIVKAADARSVKPGNARMFFGYGDAVVQKYLRDMDKVRWFQNLLVSSDKGGLEKINRLREYANTMKLIRQGDTVLLHLENAKDVKNFQALRKLLGEFPEGIKWLGSILPAGAFVVTMSKAVSDEATTSGEIIESLKTVLVPIVGGWQLIKNVGVNFEDLKNGKLPTMSDAGVAALGMTIITFEGIRLASGAYEGVVVQGFKLHDIKWAAKTVAKTAFMHPIDIAKSVGYMSRGAFHIAKAVQATYSPAVKLLLKSAEKIPKKGWLAVVAGWLVAAAAGASILDKKDNVELEYELKKQGYIDAKWDLTPKFYAEFQGKDDAAKKEILHDLFWAMVDTSEKRPNVHFDAKAREFVIVTNKSEEKNWWQSVLDTDTLFRDQLTRMGIDVLVISEEDIVKPVETRREKVASIKAPEAK